MPTPQIHDIAPAHGPTGGGALVRLTGTGFGEVIEVFFGDAPALVVAVRETDESATADVRSPAGMAGLVDVRLRNLDDAEEPVAGEEVVLAGAYRYERAPIVAEADLTRLVRTLLRELKRQVLANTSIAVSVDYGDEVHGAHVLALAEVPSLVLTGPRLSENRGYATRELGEQAAMGPAGPEVVFRRPPYTVDLGFTLTGASDRTAELLNLMAAVATFLSRNRWIEMPRDPADLGAGSVRWELDADGDFRARLDGPGDVRAFSCGLVIRGFDVDEGLPFDLSRPTSDAPRLDTGALQQGDSL